MENKLNTVDAETLLSTPMSKTMFIVDNLIPQGVNVISGASKIGKSWLMLWLGLQVAQGLPVWGLTTQQCDVLYLSLEDTQRRIKDRLYNLTDTAPSNLYFAVMCGLIGGGLEEQITDFISDYQKTKLIIIDILQKVRDTKGGAGKTGMYGNDYDDISSIKRIADELICSRHQRTNLISKTKEQQNMNHLNEKNSVLNRPMYLCLCPVCLGQFLDTGIYKIVRENHGQAKERCDFCNYRNGYDFIIYSKAEKKDEVADEWQ